MRESFCDYLRPFRNKQKLINENENIRWRGARIVWLFNGARSTLPHNFPSPTKVNSITYIPIDFTFRFLRPTLASAEPSCFGGNRNVRRSHSSVKRSSFNAWKRFLALFSADFKLRRKVFISISSPFLSLVGERRKRPSDINPALEISWLCWCGDGKKKKQKAWKLNYLPTFFALN